MRKYFLILLGFVSILSAQEGSFALKTSILAMNMDYREYDDNSQILDSEKSDFSQMVGVGVGASYLLNATNGNYALLELTMEFLSGKTDYVGAYLSSNAGYGSLLGSTNNTILNIEANYMYAQTLWENVHFLYGAAFGQRSWKRELSQSQVEVYKWVYGEPKIALQYQLDKMELRLMSGYKYGIHPKMSATGIANDFNLGAANTLEISFHATYALSKTREIGCSYKYENQSIQKSNVVYGSDGTGYLEPDSTANNQYIRVTMVFKY